ncbi:formate dehydrogenase subunit alpha [Ferrimonas balearica]|uniref:formate dehydrogenase subunit alpha n=1 Tax=Ferrimonas balearica TaxID=44012 RepID=UPI001C9A2AB2|nr:formate dehydrogenase subunit alpha [Ferrimonas balearica]MBY5920528.1 formate dehydrogenase subunit alpha [Ferrimonas balearica]MBY5996787.1 formate dehydrogenase subunit alpha [Ferrimonas balearica]
MIEITLDSKVVVAEKGVRLLDFAKSQGVAIPTLCERNVDGPKVPCDLCVVEVNGELQRSCELTLAEPITVVSHSEAITAHRQAALKRILADHHADCEAPCKTACPAAVDVQSYLYHIAQGDAVAATAVVKQSLPMPLSIGRVCPAFCETECRRTLVDEPLAIRQLKRHAADIDLDGEPHLAPIEAPIGKKVAIIGAGPAGLAAGYYLTHDGVEVDVFEAMPEAGGWLRYGIPEYRLPKATLRKEIELMCRAGMRIHTNTALGREIQLDTLKQEYDAVCLAIGAQKAVRMDYPGSTLEGVILGVDYLKAFSSGLPVATGKKVAVVGGGNTAIDCARTALRQGAEVTLIYRRTKADMPAEDYEIHEAEVEGINFRFMSVPVENQADDNGRVCRVKVERLELGEPDASGRRSPQPTGEFEWMEFDTVIPAVSQKPDTSFIPKGAIPLTRWNTADACPDSLHTGIDNVFAIGDFRLGPATAVEAIGEGRRSAEAMLRFFKEGQFRPEPVQFNARKAASLKEVEARFYDEIPFKARLKMPELLGERRTGSFDEVELGFGVDEAIAEAARCLACGCQKSQSCDLRDYATEYRIRDEDLLNPAPQKFALDESSPFIRLDRNRCISCGQCVQACREQGVHNVLNFPDGQPLCRVQVGEGELMASSDCAQCGMCIQACPVGAITARTQHQHGQKETYKKVNTICTYCGVGCGLTLHVDEAKNRVVKVTGVEGSPVNDGMLCVKGRFGFDFIASSERLTQPLIRKDGELQPASWPDAIAYVAARLGEIKARHGNDALAGFSSAKATNEDNYLFQKFVRTALGTNNVDHCARLCHATTVTGLEPAVGSGAMTNDIPSIQHSDLILIIGSDTSNAHPIIASHLKQAVKRGARLVVIDPRKIDMAFHADLYLSQRPGTDVMLLNAVMQEILRNGWQDDAYLAARTEGLDTLNDEVMRCDYSLDNAAAVTGIKADDIAALARMIGTAERTAVYYAMGITQHTTGTDNVRSLANLQLLCGNIGIEGGGINPLRGQSNVQGACDMGALPNYLPGYQKLPDDGLIDRFQQHWGAVLSRTPGLKLTEMVDAMAEGQIKGLYVMGENPVLSDPDQHHVIEALEALEFLVVQDIFLTETARMADVVLPAHAFAEKAGHFTNTERRVQRLNPAVIAPGEARADWAILQSVANAMGLDWHYQDERAICDEICAVTPSYRGITWARTEAESLQWPCPDASHPGTPVMHTERFLLTEKAQLAPVSFRVAAELPCEEYPLVLTTGRQLAQFHTGTMTRKTKGLDEMAGPVAMIAVQDAERLGLVNGQRIKVATRRGELEVPAFITKRMQPGVVFVPFHFAEAAANVLTNSALDPEAKIPEYKVCAARVVAA